MLANVDCELCSRQVIDLKTGKPKLYNGKPMPRKKPPCAAGEDMCPKVKPGHSDLTPMNRDILSYWRDCQTLGMEPGDAHTRLWFRVIEEARQEGTEELARREAKRRQDEIDRLKRRG